MELLAMNCYETINTISTNLKSKQHLIHCYTTLCIYKTITTKLMVQPDVRTLLEAESAIKFNIHPQKLRTKDLTIVGSNTLKWYKSNSKH